MKGKIMNDPFLPLIETPQGLVKRLAHDFTRRQFGNLRSDRRQASGLALCSQTGMT